MRKSLYRNKWFILVAMLALFFMATSTKVALAGTDTELLAILNKGLEGLAAFFTFLIDVLKEVW